jgi:hypothetical protein
MIISDFHALISGLSCPISVIRVLYCHAFETAPAILEIQSQSYELRATSFGALPFIVHCIPHTAIVKPKPKRNIHVAQIFRITPFALL